MLRCHHVPDVTAGLFDLQREVVSASVKRKALVCGRRGGKTTMDARLDLQSALLNPPHGEDESITAYVAPTKGQAKRLMWGRLATVSAQLGVALSMNSSDLIARTAAGAQIWLMGADDPRDIERLRGFAYRRVIIDEAQALTIDFEELIEDVLDPALADYDGDMILTGTPNASCVGYFHDATTGALQDDLGDPMWRTWSWTLLDNPCFPRWRGREDWRARAAEFMETKRRVNGWAEDHPTYQREWLGRWVRDDGALVYQYSPTRNDWDGVLPEGHKWHHVLGVDLGQRDAFALVCWAYSRTLPDLFCAESWKAGGLSINDWARFIDDWQRRYKPAVTVADMGGLGKAIVEDINARYGLGIVAAEKTAKLAAIESFNSDLLSAWTHIPRHGPYARELSTIQWAETRAGIDRTKEDPRYPNDLADAGLYGYRAARSYTWKPEEHQPPAGTEGHAAAIAERLRKQRIEEQRKAAKARRRYQA